MTRPAGKLSVAVFLAFAVLAFCPAASRGQSFAFAVGSGGGHRHHHGGWWAGYGVGPYWGPGWWGPPPIVYAPPPVIQPSVVYVQPPAVAAVPVPTPSYSSSPPPTSNSLAANTAPSLTSSRASDDRIVIRNVAGAQLPVTFLVDNQDIELADGATRTFVGKTHRTIQYDRGGKFGSTQQDLTGGQYEFRITSSGWDLVRKGDNFTSRTAIRSNSLPDSGVAR